MRHIMNIKPLDKTPIHTIIDCFLLAFDNYFVAMPTDKSYYKDRWKEANVDFSLSYGMFDGERLVGFILHAIDTRCAVLTAYNAGTGVIPEYRGKRVVKSIYEFAIPHLQKHGIKKSTLEVITENKKAIKAYEGIGFKICKTYKCFNGDLQFNHSDDFELLNKAINQVDWNSLPDQTWYAWDSQKESILNGNYQFYYVIHANEPESYFIIKPKTNYIAQCGVLTSGDNVWNRLFSAIGRMTNTIKINNVDSRHTQKLDWFNRFGLNNVVDQYEMELSLV